MIYYLDVNSCIYIAATLKGCGLCDDDLMKGRSPKAAALSLIVHRLRGSNETANYLHQCGHYISYVDIQLLKTSWASRVTRHSSHNLPAKFQNRKAVYIYP